MRYLATVAALALILAVTAAAGAITIRDRAEYRPSSDLVLGALDPLKGYQIAADFQINLEYQAGIPDAAVEAINDYSDPAGALNWSDNDYYYLRVDAVGNLPIGIYDGSQAGQQYGVGSGEDWVQWTLSGWWSGEYHTIFAGDIVGNCLHIRPPQGYRAFLGDGLYNPVEVFNGAVVLSEVLCYEYTEPLGEGSTLKAKLVPEPVTMAGLALGIGSLATYLRRRRAA